LVAIFTGGFASHRRAVLRRYDGIRGPVTATTARCAESGTAAAPGAGPTTSARATTATTTGERASSRRPPAARRPAASGVHRSRESLAHGRYAGSATRSGSCGRKRLGRRPGSPSRCGRDLLRSAMTQPGVRCHASAGVRAPGDAAGAPTGELGAP
jgi:hypothetical protein